MNLSTPDLAHLLLALALLLTAAHGLGYLFRRLRQPPVIGEILGGLMLGPTLFGWLLPDWQKAVFSSNSATSTMLGATYQLGLLLLMFCSGGEMRASFPGRDRKTVGIVTATGTIIPFFLGLCFLRLIDAAPLVGPAQSPASFLLVFAIAVAVTSIPVISRIMADLGILETPFARIVLAVAVLEDIVLYVVLAAALAVVGARHGGTFGLPRLLGVDGASNGALAYSVAASVLFFALAFVAGPGFFRWAGALRLNLLRKNNPVAHLLVFLLLMTGVAVFIGVPPMFGAFVAGIVTGVSDDDAGRPRETIKNFSMAFFIPIYFAIVGLKLDLIRYFDPRFFLLFLSFACAAKFLSVLLGARLAGESEPGSLNLAVALNARGGPGIVVASLAYDAKIISEGFYVILVMTAIVTSLLAGSWLDLIVRRGLPLR